MIGLLAFDVIYALLILVLLKKSCVDSMNWGVCCFYFILLTLFYGYIIYIFSTLFKLYCINAMQH